MFRLIAPFPLAALLIGCGGPGDGLTDRSKLLVQQVGDAGAGACMYGGNEMAAGFDDNGNGKLDPAEVTATWAECTGAPGAIGAAGADGADGAYGANGTDGAPAHAAVFDTQSVDPGATCAAGGQQVFVGIDDGAGGGVADDGVLQPSEARVTYTVCNGVDGYSTLLLIVPESAGTHCVAAGQKVLSGLDDGAGGGTARDGILQNGEIRSTAYLCNGVDGQNGHNSLLLMTAEPAGVHCTSGGQRIDSGVDDGHNGGTADDGLLQTVEVLATSYVCNGDVGAAGDSPISAVSAIPAGATCPAGGERISFGMDDGAGGGVAGDGTLQAGEVDTAAVVCNGADGINGADGTDGTDGANGSDGYSSLISVTAEPAGANCPDGGQRIQAGLDNGAGGGVARDGTLQAGEVTVNRYVCDGADGTDGTNGTNGTNGTDGTNALVKVTAETAGAHCVNGGERIDVGPDSGAGGGVANDGVLQSGEITSTSYVCNGADGSSGAAGSSMVTDSAGHTLGTLVSLDWGVTILTSGGYLVSLNWDGTYPPSQIYYSGASCTGTAYLNDGGGIDDQLYGKTVVYSYSQNALMIPAVVDAYGVSYSAPFSAATIDNPTCMTGGSNTGWQLKTVTTDAIGMPAVVTPPLVLP